MLAERVPSAWSIVCDSPELAIDAAQAARRIGLAAAPLVVDDVWQTASESLERGDAVAIVSHRESPIELLVDLADAAVAGNVRVPIAWIGEQPRQVALDLGLIAVDDVAPLVAVCALLDVDVSQPWAATTKDLSGADRARLGDVVSNQDNGALVRCDDGMIGHKTGREAPRVLGFARDVSAAVLALRNAHFGKRPRVPKVEGVEEEAVLDVILGPPRALSDPASKAALRPYDIPLPAEELCTTPSRAASESARIGFPVRMTLASPDLRTWDHPDLVTDDVLSAAHAREIFRQMNALARSRKSDARILGVTVSATSLAKALLRVRLQPLANGAVLADIGFADPHGLASTDHTQTILPVTADGLERVLSRLHGSGLLLGTRAAERKRAVKAIGDVLMRLAAFAHQWRTQIEAVEVHPLAVLASGELEVRQACVTVGDAFSKSLAAMGH